MRKSDIYSTKWGFLYIGLSHIIKRRKEIKFLINTQQSVLGLLNFGKTPVLLLIKEIVSHFGMIILSQKTRRLDWTPRFKNLNNNNN